MFKKIIEIDPVAQNLVNRIAPGTSVSGQFHSEGGLLIQGKANCTDMRVVNGPLVLQEGASLTGTIVVHGDAFLFGKLGDATSPHGGVNLEVHGAVHVATTAETFGQIACQSLATYKGCQLNSAIRTIPKDASPLTSEAAA
ncbi:polymer-forming cytoskeletal protein [Acidovorax sp.]|uniref:bactofilin family protein n=1 Tax=Acidovorax sp. TaxID=1872122 RepID=UPI0025C2D1FB|nr:polymer-forming cytoskeletal protein [Acidovorax sp.]